MQISTFARDIRSHLVFTSCDPNNNPRFRPGRTPVQVCLAFVLLVILATSTTGQEQQVTESTFNYFENTYKSRSRIRSAILDYEMVWEKNKTEETSEGAVSTYRVWFAKGRFRMDLNEVRPKDTARERNMKLALIDGTYRLIDDARNPDFQIREYTAEYTNKEGPPVSPLSVFDPRLFGVGRMEYHLFKHEQLDDLRRVPAESKVEIIHPQEANDHYEVRASYPDGVMYLDKVDKRSNLPIKMRTKFADRDAYGKVITPTAVETEVELREYVTPEGMVTFPSSFHIRRIKDGNVIYAQLITVKHAEFNTEIPDDVFGWTSLAPLQGSRLIKDGDESAFIVWNGRDFDHMTLKEFIKSKARVRTTMVRSRTLAYYLLGNSAVILVLFGLYVYRSKFYNK